MSAQKRKALPWLLPACWVCFSATSYAAPFLPRDVNTTRTVPPVEQETPAGFVTMGGVAYFAADDGIHGNELWRSDGTAAGTWLVRDLCPGVCASVRGGFSVVGTLLYFGAHDGVHGYELWRSDGTAAGTELVLDLVPGLRSGASGPVIPLGSSLVFASAAALWVSHDLGATASQLTPPELGLVGNVFGELGGRVAFIGYSEADGWELWATDGTPAGTERLDVRPGPEDGVRGGWSGRAGTTSVVVAGDLLLFAGHDGVSRPQLWRTDGTPAGTRRVGDDLLPGSVAGDPRCLVAVGDAVYFGASDLTRGGGGLWRSDGTPAGTVLIANSAAAEVGPQPCHFTQAGAKLFFTVIDHASGAGRELWVTDGTKAGTTAVVDIRPGAADLPWWAQLAARGDDLLFFANDGVHGVEPWITSGTAATTALLADLVPGPASVYGPAWPIAIGSRWLFRGGDEADDPELAVSDGTPAGTHQLAEIHAVASSLPMYWGYTPQAAAAGGAAVFSLADEATGYEPWAVSRSGGTLLADIAPGAGSSTWPFYSYMTGLGGFALFTAGHTESSRGLWYSDGSPSGTRLASDAVYFPRHFTRLGQRILFAAQDRLWETDENASAVDPFDVPSNAQLLQRAASRLYLYGSGGFFVVVGAAPPVAVGASIPQFEYPEWTAAAGDRLFYVLNDGYDNRTWWTSDGTAGGTLRLVSASWPRTWDLVDDFEIDSRDHGIAGALLFVGEDAATGREPWVSDGTPAGTRRLLDVRPGPDGSEPTWITATVTRLFFAADDGINGRELWVTDGTAAGTRLLDLLPGAESSRPRNFVAIGDRILFSAYHPAFGVEAWVSDGTPEGTFRWSDIAPGPLSSSPLEFTAATEHVYFAANDNVTGFEVWAIDKNELTSPPTFFHTVAPCRVFDSRDSSAIGAEARRVEIAGACGIPSTARAVAANVTVVASGASGQLLSAPHFAPQPPHELLPVVPGRTRAQQSVVRLGYGAVDLQTAASGAEGVHVIVDVSGWFE
jgi:ELWxxDGT repeat protein